MEKVGGRGTPNKVNDSLGNFSLPLYYPSMIKLYGIHKYFPVLTLSYVDFRRKKSATLCIVKNKDSTPQADPTNH
jgi:hypothetical protein